MNVAEELALAATSFRETLRLLENVVTVHPEAETILAALSMSESTEPGVRALLKVLLAMGTFALGQERAERTIHALAKAQRTAASARWVN